MRRYVLKLDYGTHSRVDSFHDSKQKAQWEQANVVAEYRKSGFVADHRMDGAVVMRKCLGARPVTVYPGEDVDIPVWAVVVLTVEARHV